MFYICYCYFFIFVIVIFYISSVAEQTVVVYQLSELPVKTALLSILRLVRPKTIITMLQCSPFSAQFDQCCNVAVLQCSPVYAVVGFANPLLEVTFKSGEEHVWNAALSDLARLALFWATALDLVFSV